MNRGVLARLALGAALLGALALGAAGCATLAEWTAPAKRASTARTPLAARADELFWRVLHTGAYERIPEALAALKAAYVADPHDAVTAAHIGFLHIWRLSERTRLPGGGGAEITDHAALGAKVLRGSGAPGSRRRALPGLLRRAPHVGGIDPQGRQADASRLLHPPGRGGGVARVQPLHRGLRGGVTAPRLGDVPAGARRDVARRGYLRGRAAGPRQPGLRARHAARDPGGASARVLELVDRAPQLRGLLPPLRRHAGQGG